MGAMYGQRVDSSTQQIHTGVPGLARAQGAGARVGKQRIEVRGSHGQAGDGIAEQIELPGLRVEGLGFRVSGFGRAEQSELPAVCQGVGFRVWGLGFRV